MDHGYEVVGVYTQPDRPAGRGRGLLAPPVKTYALEWGLPVFQPASLRPSASHKELAALAPDVVVVAAYGRMLPNEVLALPRLGCLNIHPSLLPLHRGPSPVAFTLLDGDPVAGVSVMVVGEGMDDGPVVARQEEAILPEDTTGVLTDRLFRVGADLLLRSLPRYLQGELTPAPQDEARATYARKLTKEDGELRWEQSAATLWREVRAYSPWPSSYTHWDGRLLKVLEAWPLPETAAGPPGTVVALAEGAAAQVGVTTGKGVLGLVRLQLEGKRPLAAEEFLRGHPDFPGAVLTPA